MTIRELLAEESPTLRRRLASLFSGLPDETPASPLSCAAGEVVVRQDAPCRCVYVLVEGRADASGLQPGGPSHTYSEFGPLTLFGEYEALCGANCFLAEVRARTACRFWVLAREDYFSWFFSGRDTTSPGYGRWCAACGSRPAGSGVTCLWTATAAFSPSWSPGMRPTPEAGRPASP